MSIDHFIDAHVHVWTSDRSRYPLADVCSRDDTLRASFTSEEFLAVARPAGVERAVLVQMDFYGIDNSYLLDTIERFPGVYCGIAQVDERLGNLDTELERLKTRGIQGVRIVAPSEPGSTWLGHLGMQELWQHCTTRQMAVCPLINAEHIPDIFRMCKLFPKTRVVIDHVANIGSDGEFREADLKSLCALARCENVYVKVSGFYYLGQKRPPYAEIAPMVRLMFEAFGPERLMWGSDSPFQLESPNNYQAGLDFVSDRLDFLRSGDKAWLLKRTAEKVFFT